MDNKNIILPRLQFEDANDDDLSLRISFDKKENLLRENERNVVLDVSKLFDDERNSCLNYKIFGKIRMVFKNLYYGNSPYAPLKRNLYLRGDGSDGDFTGYLPYNEFAFLRNDVYREVNIPNVGSNPGSFTQNIVLYTGNTDHTIITSIDAPYKNWNIYLSYVFTGDTEHVMSYTLSGGTYTTFKAKDGIPFRVEENGNYYTLTSPVEHGINQGEYVILSGGTFTSSVPVSGRTFYIESVGNETYNSEKYVLNILKSEIPSGNTLSTIMLGKRCLDKNRLEQTTSVYYVHKHKTLTEENDYILDKVGFESPIFEDERKLVFENSQGVNDFLVERNRNEALIYEFKKPLVLSGVTNNLGYTPTDIYTTVIFRNGNGYFDYPPKVGWKFNFHDTWIDKHFDGTTSNETTITSTQFTKTINATTYTFNSGNTLPIGTVLTGAFVEYNNEEFKERIISESFHKFTISETKFEHNQSSGVTFDGASSTNKVGLFYQPHYRVKLRELSPYVESSTTKDVYDLPENLIYDEVNKVWKWRSLYKHGFIDVDGRGTNFPFLNNSHYVKSDINFYLRNEVLYKNKQDGLIGFTNIQRSKINC